MSKTKKTDPMNKLKIKLHGCAEMTYTGGKSIKYNYDNSTKTYNVTRQHEYTLEHLITFHESALVYMMWEEPEKKDFLQSGTSKMGDIMNGLPY